MSPFLHSYCPSLLQTWWICICLSHLLASNGLLAANSLCRNHSSGDLWAEPQNHRLKCTFDLLTMLALQHKSCICFIMSKLVQQKWVKNNSEPRRYERFRKKRSFWEIACIPMSALSGQIWGFIALSAFKSPLLKKDHYQLIKNRIVWNNVWVNLNFLQGKSCSHVTRRPRVQPVEMHRVDTYQAINSSIPVLLPRDVAFDKVTSCFA